MKQRNQKNSKGSAPDNRQRTAASFGPENTAPENAVTENQQSTVVARLESPWWNRAIAVASIVSALMATWQGWSSQKSAAAAQAAVEEASRPWIQIKLGSRPNNWNFDERRAQLDIMFEAQNVGGSVAQRLFINAALLPVDFSRGYGKALDRQSAMCDADRKNKDRFTYELFKGDPPLRQELALQVTSAELSTVPPIVEGEYHFVVVGCATYNSTFRIHQTRFMYMLAQAGDTPANTKVAVGRRDTDVVFVKSPYGGSVD